MCPAAVALFFAKEKLPHFPLRGKAHHSPHFLPLGKRAPFPSKERVAQGMSEDKRNENVETGIRGFNSSTWLWKNCGAFMPSLRSTLRGDGFGAKSG